MTRFVIAGCGYTGRRLAPLLLEHGPVLAIARSERSTHGLPDAVAVCHADLGGFEPSKTLCDATIVYLAPPPGHGDRDTTLESFLEHAGTPQRLVYTSTSGVYGNCQGERVDERRPPAPQTARAMRRYAAESVLRDWCGQTGTTLVILRVAGIYGPGRLPLQRIERGEPVLREQDAGPGNRIHVDDLARTCVQAATAGHPPGIVNVCDGDHTSGTAFTKLVARIAGLPEPPSITLDEARRVFSPMRWSFLSESRRLDNTRLRTELGVELRYTEPQTGIRASL